jgi:hypothetical protein
MSMKRTDTTMIMVTAMSTVLIISVVMVNMGIITIIIINIKQLKSVLTIE